MCIFLFIEYSSRMSYKKYNERIDNQNCILTRFKYYLSFKHK